MNNFFSCNEIKEMISAYFDNELNEKDTKIVKKHLKECLTCRRKLADIRKISTLIKRAYSGYSFQAKKRQRVAKVILSSIAAAMSFMILGWFAVIALKPEKTSIIETNKPIYVKAEDYFLSGLYEK